MIGKYNKSVILTYLGAALSVLGMVYVSKDKLSYAMLCLIYAGVCDLFDGAVARKCKRTEEEKEFGVQIDSLTDMISFIAFPVVLGLYSMQDIPYVAAGVMVVFTICGIIRLAWFNIHTNPEVRMSYYEGLPVTSVALVFPLVYLVMELFKMEADSWVTAVFYLVIAFLYISKAKIKKPTGIWYVIFGVLAIGVTVAILMLP